MFCFVFSLFISVRTVSELFGLDTFSARHKIIVAFTWCARKKYRYVLCIILDACTHEFDCCLAVFCLFLAPFFLSLIPLSLVPSLRKHTMSLVIGAWISSVVLPHPEHRDHMPFFLPSLPFTHPCLFFFLHSSLLFLSPFSSFLLLFLPLFAVSLDCIHMTLSEEC